MSKEQYPIDKLNLIAYYLSEYHCELVHRNKLYNSRKLEISIKEIENLLDEIFQKLGVLYD